MANALLYSGGLDSSCAWWLLGKPPAVYCGGMFGPARMSNLGELMAIERQCEISPEFLEKLTQVEVDFRPFMRDGSWLLPRDSVCAMAAWGAGFDGAMIAWCAEDGSSTTFIAETRQRLQGAVSFPFTVEFPVSSLTKRELIAGALAKGAPLEFILASHSCVTRSDKPCGKCVNCRERDAALAGTI